MRLRRQAGAPGIANAPGEAALNDGVQPSHRMIPGMMGPHPRATGAHETRSLAGCVEDTHDGRLVLRRRPGHEKMLAGDRVDAARRDGAGHYGHAERHRFEDLVLSAARD